LRQGPLHGTTQHNTTQHNTTQTTLLHQQQKVSLLFDFGCVAFNVHTKLPQKR
jgi:hypothetical protein